MRNRWTLFLSVALALSFGSSTSSQTETPQNLRKWTASWIACTDAPVRDAGVFHFRRLLTLKNVPAHFVVHVSADNQFLLHVNQQRVGSGPARGDLAHWRFETYDLAPFLRAGTNVLAATVWNFGENSAIAQMSDRLGFMLQSEDKVETKLSTDENWEVEHEEGVG